MTEAEVTAGGACVWHRVPGDLQGRILYPLHELESRYPDVYALARSRYDGGREHVLDFRVPILHLRWNDFLHCSTVHPRLVRETWIEEGYDLDARASRDEAWLSGRFFEIPLERIADTPALWYTAADLTAPEESFSIFEPHRYRPSPRVSDAYREHVRSVVAGTGPPLMYFHSPHVLVAGPIDIAGLHVIDWRDPIPES